MFTAVHASHNPVMRYNLYPYLDGFRHLSNLPWIVLGDFNEITTSSEKKGSSLPFCNIGFQSWIHRNALVDLGYKGPNYTWCRGSHHYTDAVIRHLPRLHSDHSPLLLSVMMTNHGPSHNRPFRFQSMWLSHADFPKMVNTFWDNTFLPLDQKLEAFRNHLQLWNK